MITVCIIVKDDEKNLETCLKRIHAYNFEIVVVDTGSRDHSKEIARKYTDQVYDFKWCDDFSKARNFSISKANNDVVMILDSDEFIMQLKKKELLKKVDSHEPWIGTIAIEHKGSKNDGTDNLWAATERIFNRKLFRYEGSVHEQIVPIDEKKQVQISYIECPVSVEHVGYVVTKEKLEAKGLRNLRILQTKEKTEKLNAYDCFQIGQCYAAMNQEEKAIPYYEKALDMIENTSLLYVQELVRVYGYSLIATKQYRKALTLEVLYNDYKNNSDYLFLMAEIFLNNKMYDRSLLYFNAATKATECRYEGTNSYKAYYNMAYIEEQLGRKENAIMHYKLCGNYYEAKEALKRLVL